MTAADVPAVIHIASGTGLPQWTTDNYLIERDSPVAHFLVAEADTNIAGFAGAHIVLDEAELLIIAVSLSHLRSGIGSQLLARLLLDAHHRGVKRVWLDVRVDNAPARALYRNHGFIDANLRKRYYKDGGDALIMSRVLA